MNMPETDLEMIDITIEAAKEEIGKYEALQRLLRNKDFQLVIMDSYIKDESTRIALATANPALAGAAEQVKLHDGIKAIGYLNQFFVTTRHIADAANKAIIDNEATRDELLAEEGV